MLSDDGVDNYAQWTQINLEEFLKGISDVQEARPNAKGEAEMTKKEEIISKIMTFVVSQTWVQILALSLRDYKIWGN